MKPHLIGVLFICLVLSACFSPRLSQLEKGSLRTVEGQIDNVTRGELPYEKKMLSFTSVGFLDGQSITLVGIQPGLTRGKRVRIRAEFIRNINGTDAFTLQQIEALAARAPDRMNGANEIVTTPPVIGGTREMTETTN